LALFFWWQPCFCSDGEQQLVIEESFEKTHDLSTYVPPITIKYEIMIDESQEGGDIVSDGRGYTYFFKIDYPNLRVWRCTYRGVKFPRCNATLKQSKKPGVDFFRTHFQEDFTMKGVKAHSHPPNYGVEKRQLTVVQSSSTTNGPSFNLENIVTILIRHLALLKSDSLKI
jgi:hypothetical protein